MGANYQNLLTAEICQDPAGLITGLTFIPSLSFAEENQLQMRSISSGQ
jgi:hypothetical protein